MLEAMLLACRYASADALEKLGVVYREATGLLQEYYGCFVDETRLAGKGTAMIEEETGVAALERDMLQKKIARPLSECCLLCLTMLAFAHPPFTASTLVVDTPWCAICHNPFKRLQAVSVLPGKSQTSHAHSPKLHSLLQASCRRRCRGRLCCGRAASWWHRPSCTTCSTP